MLKLPLAAVFRDGDARAVFVNSGGRAKFRHVSVGRRNGVAAEIVDGLDDGECVLLHRSDRVVDGVRVARRS